MKCGFCGKTATGSASISKRVDGRWETVAYCHGDADAEPTCYEQAQWGLATDLDDPFRVSAEA